MAESLILPNSTFSANNITTTGNVVISSALYLGTTSLQVSVSTGGVNANVYSAGSLVRQGYAPTYVELSTAPSVAAEGDKWWSTSNSMPFRYLSGGWRKLGVVVAPALYEFTNATFTPGGATGRNGPILSAAKGGLSGTPTPSTWYDNTSFFNMTTQGIQKWTVPATGTYTIVAAGAASGGTAGSPDSGRGIVIYGNFSLTEGSVINILVGQKGLKTTGGCGSSGGGGGSYVISSSGPIIIAGGGGGLYLTPASLPVSYGTTSTTGQNATDVDVGQTPSGRGVAGPNGGIGGHYGGGGGGYSGNGTGGWNSPPYGFTGLGYSYTSGGVGGDSTSNNAVGGFGGGGGTHGCNGGGGGGGGYGGGGGGSDYTDPGAGGGGGSYSTVSINSSGYNTGAGYVTITKI